MWIKLHDCEFMDVGMLQLLSSVCLIIFFQRICFANKFSQDVQAFQDCQVLTTACVHLEP